MRVLNKFEVNEISIAIAILTVKETSLSLRMEKLWEIFDLLKFEIDLPEIDDINMEDEESIRNFAMGMKTPDILLELDRAVAYRDMRSMKLIILKRLIELEAYLEIVELGLDKIKVI